MKVLRNIALLIALLAAASALLFRTPQRIPEGANTPYYGYITSGEAFGVQIADSATQARTMLERRRFYSTGKYDCLSELRKLSELIGCNASQSYELYYVKDRWRNGNLYLETSDEKIVAIIWTFNLLPHIDP